MKVFEVRGKNHQNDEEGENIRKCFSRTITCHCSHCLYHRFGVEKNGKNAGIIPAFFARSYILFIADYCTPDNPRFVASTPPICHPKILPLDVTADAVNVPVFGPDRA